jgi:hypothetical protein
MASLAASLNMTPGSLRSKSLGARNYRASFAPVNGSSFKSLEQLKFQLPSVPRTYADLTTCVIRGKISSESGAATDVCFLERNVYSIINRLEVSVANQQLDNIPNYNVLVHAMADIGAGVMNSGQYPYQALLAGGDIACKALGAPLARADATGQTGTRSFAFPMPSLGIFGMGKLLPCDVAENITMTLHLEDYRSCLIHGSAVPTGYELTELTLECNFVELSAESEAALQGSLGSSPAVFDYEAVNSTSFTKQTGDLTLSQNIGSRVSSLSRMLMIMRNSASQQSATQLSLTSRSHANISEMQVKIGGVAFPQISIKNTTSNQADALVALQMFEGDFGWQSLVGSLNQPALFDYNVLDKLSTGASNAEIVTALNSGLIGSTAAANTNTKAATVGNNTATTNTHIRPEANAAKTKTNFARVSNFGIEDGVLATATATGITRATQQTDVGSFMLGLNLQVFLNNESLFNPVSTIGQNVSVDLKFSAASTAAQVINVYSFYHQIVQLNPLTRMYEIAGQ